MKRTVTLLSFFTLIALGVGWYSRKSPAPKFAASSEAHLMSLEEKLNTIIIADYPAAGVAVEEAIEILRVKSRQAGSSSSAAWPRGVNFVIIAGGDRRVPRTSGLTMRGVSLAEALHHITSVAGLKYTVERNAVTIREVNDPRVPVYPETVGLRNYLEKRILPKVSFQDATLEEAVEYLRVNRGCLDSDLTQEQKMAARLNYVMHLRESVKRTPISVDLEDIPLPEALRYCAEISDARLRYDSFAVMVTDTDDVPPASIPASPLILPTVALEGATLAESIDFIRTKSREISPDHSEADIVVKPGSSSPAINLWLKDIPLSEALRYIAELSGHTLTWDGRSYVLTPANGR